MDRTLSGVAVTGAILILGALASPLASGEVYIHSDLQGFYVPIRDFYQHALREGHGFIWFPYEFAGFHLHGEGQAGLFHPFNLLLYRFVPLTPALHVELLRSYVLSLLGMVVFLRRWQLPRSAAVLAGLSFSFCAFNLVHYMHLNIVAAAGHLPWLLAASDVALRSPRPERRAAGSLAAGLLMTSQLLVGHPQAVWMSSLVTGAYILMLARGRLGAVARLIGALCLGVGGAAVQLLPVWESLGRSFRMAPSAEFLSEYSLVPVNLVQMVAPYLFDGRVVGTSTIEFSIYAGAVELALCTWLVVHARCLRRARLLGFGALGLALLGLWLMLGEAGLLYRLVQRLPVVGLFRVPARYSFILEFAVAVASGVAFADLAETARAKERPGWPSLWPFTLVALASIAAALSTRALLRATPLYQASIASPALVWAGPLLVIGAVGATVAAARGRRWALVALVALAVVDHASYGLSWVARGARATPDELRGRHETPQLAEGMRIYGAPIDATMRGVRLFDGYVAMTPTRALAAGFSDEDGDSIEASMPALRVSSVSWAFGQKIEGALPRARLVTRAVVSDDPSAAIRRIDVESTAIVDRGVDLEAGPMGRADIVMDRPGEIDIAVRAPSRQLLVVSESHHPGWTAQVDDVDGEVVRVYGDLMGCVVPSGRHLVHFRFRPRSLRDGAWISAASLCLLFGLYGTVASGLLRRRAR